MQSLLRQPKPTFEDQEPHLNIRQHCFLLNVLDIGTCHILPTKVLRSRLAWQPL